MFLDLNHDRHWDEPAACKSCRQAILPSHSTEQLNVAFDADHRLHELNGMYHSECAKPLLSIMRAIETMSRSFF